MGATIASRGPKPFLLRGSNGKLKSTPLAVVELTRKSDREVRLARTHAPSASRQAPPRGTNAGGHADCSACDGMGAVLPDRLHARRRCHRTAPFVGFVAFAIAVLAVARADAEGLARMTVEWGKLEEIIRDGAQAIFRDETFRSGGSIVRPSPARTFDEARPDQQWVGSSPRVALLLRDWGEARGLTFL